MKLPLNFGKKGMETQTIIYLILGIIIVLVIVHVITGKTKITTTHVRSIVEGVSDGWKKLIGEETDKEKSQRTADEQQLLTFTQQITSTIDTCLDTPYAAPCLCSLDKPQLFPENYALILTQQEDEQAYFSIPAAIVGKGQRLLENPAKHSVKQPFTFCIFQPESRPTPSFSFFTKNAQFYIQLSADLGGISYSLRPPLVFYRPSNQEICFLPTLDNLSLYSFPTAEQYLSVSQQYKNIRKLPSCFNNKS